MDVRWGLGFRLVVLGTYKDQLQFSCKVVRDL